MNSLRQRLLLGVVVLLSLSLIASVPSQAQVFPRIAATDPYWLQVKWNAEHGDDVDYSDSLYYYPQMVRLGITHAATTGDFRGLHDITSPIKVMNAYTSSNPDTSWDAYRKGVENQYQVGGDGTQFDRPPTPFHEKIDPPGTGNYVYYALVASDNAGILLHGAIPESDEPQSGTYIFTFRMKLVGDNTQHVAVANVTFDDVSAPSPASPSEHYSVFNRKSRVPSAPTSVTVPIFADGFHAPAQYEDIKISATIAGPAYNCDIRVQWLDMRDLYIDYLTVRNSDGEKLFAASDSLTTYEKIKSGLTQIHGWNPDRNFRWYGDEPHMSTWHAYSKVSALALQATEIPLNGANNYFGSATQMQQFAAIVGPSELIIDPYQIMAATDSASTGTNSLQISLDALGFDLNNGITATNGTAALWYCMQTCREDRYGGIWRRNPTRNELLAQAYLGLAYGAKGLLYFTYPTIPPWRIPGDTYNYHTYGLVDLVDASGNPTDDPHGHFVPNYKWNAVREIHNALDVIGPTLMGLHWVNAAEVHHYQLANVSSVVSDVHAFSLSGVQDTYADGTYIEIGIFDSTGSANKYCLVVNRRCLSTEQRNLQITLSNSLTSQFLQVTDVYSGTRWVVARGTSFTDLFQPGQGKLYRVEPLDLTALAAQGKTISSQATAFNGQRKLHREASGKLHEVFASGTITQGEIFYRNSTDSGATWASTAMLSDGTGASLAPCIAMRSGSNNVIVVWQQTNGSNYDVAYRRSTDGGKYLGFDRGARIEFRLHQPRTLALGCVQSPVWIRACHLPELPGAALCEIHQ